MKYIGVSSFLIILVIGIVIVHGFVKAERYYDEVQKYLPSFLENVAQKEIYSDLGAYLRCPEKEENELEVMISKKVVAELTVECEFANGKGTIRAELIRDDFGGWEASHFHISSDVFSRSN